MNQQTYESRSHVRKRLARATHVTLDAIALAMAYPIFRSVTSSAYPMLTAFFTWYSMVCKFIVSHALVVMRSDVFSVLLYCVLCSVVYYFVISHEE